MRKTFLLISVLTIITFQSILSQSGSDTLVYLLTCGPGTETYSVYGHSAIRILIPEKKTDMVYNWGVFDFDTPHFAWKFAKGRLDYQLGVESMKSFLQIYVYEKRFVYSQIINLNGDERARLVSLINENLKPENIKYRYDFFYDDCSTRIRDLLEKSVKDKLLYPPAEKGKIPTFRNLVGKYQNPYPWLMFGVDLIMGSTSDKKAAFRDRMFLPIELRNELSETVIRRDGKMIPLLQNPTVILNFPAPPTGQKFLKSPAFVFTFLLIILLILFASVKTRKLVNRIDVIVFSVFSILAVLMIFFNFFTDHPQMKWNLNIIWLNPFILLCLLSLILKRTGLVWFRIVFFISAAFIVFHLFLPQGFNIGFIPMAIILLIRSSARAGYDWNPFSLK